MQPRSSCPGRTSSPGEAAAGFRGDEAPPEPPPEVSVILEAPGWRAAVPQPERLVRRAAEAALREAGAAGAVTVLLTDDRAVRRLNARHRGKDKPTNVLSFPGGGAGGGAHLGDLALALGVVRREARENRRPARAHLAHLVAHGALHLAGHDHLAAGAARRMERAEARVMRRLGLPNPWKETAAAGTGRRNPA